MFDRLKNMPTYQVEQGEVSAQRYNLFRLALLRLGSPQRIPLPGLRALAMHLDEDSWTVIDTALNDVPVVAWTHFATADRDNLHLPIGCRVSHFHAHAALIMEPALQKSAESLRTRL